MADENEELGTYKGSFGSSRGCVITIFVFRGLGMPDIGEAK